MGVYNWILYLNLGNLMENDTFEDMPEEFYEPVDDFGDSKPGSDKQVVVVNNPHPDVIPLLLLRDRPIFPGITHPIIFTGEDQISYIQKLLKNNTQIVGLGLYTGEDENKSLQSIQPDEVAKVGVLCKIVQHREIEDGSLHILIHTIERFEILSYLTDSYPFEIRVKYWEKEKINEDDEELKAYSVALINSIRELVRTNPLFKEELSLLVGKKGIEEPGILADFSALMTTSNKFELQELLEIKEVRSRIEKVLLLLKREKEISKAKNLINKRIEGKVNKQQREFFLKQQLLEIKKELGISKDEKETEVEKIEKRVKKLKLTSEAKEKINEELEKMSFLESSSPEYHVTRNYLDWLTTLPWGKRSKSSINLKKSKDILDEDHFGLKKVKDRILEYVAVTKMKGRTKGTMLLLVGPPGVGKTSIGKSIARCLGRNFYRFSLGGMRDEAEIKGHRRTYIGAMPGKFIQALKKAKTCNPVILMDEVDKIGNSYQGDPASSLLEVLDPEQNKEFLDHFLDVHFDLSEVLFICTANQVDTIPLPLLDRMEVIDISGYITEEKLQIAKKYLIPKIIKDVGLKEKNAFTLKDDVIVKLIENYSRESGVRSLEQNLNKMASKYVKDLLLKDEVNTEISFEDVERYLGQAKFKDDILWQRGQAGIINGLAYTALGGSVLQVEATCIKGKKGSLKQTGQLGSVMVESSELAYSYIRSYFSQIKNKFFEDHFVHLHVPSGATPKDGPSAGITMALAFYSMAMNKPVKDGLGMTGELTVTGKVMPIGGLKEKLLAAKRSGLTDIVIPLENKSDLEELDKEILLGLKISFIDKFEDIISIAFKN